MLTHPARGQVHNFGRAPGNSVAGGKVLMGDESIELGLHSDYFHNLWQIELLTYEQGPTPPPPGSPPPPPPLPPLHCDALRSQPACENITRAAILAQVRASPPMLLRPLSPLFSLATFLTLPNRTQP